MDTLVADIRARLEAIHAQLDTALDGDDDRQYAAERALDAMAELLVDIAGNVDDEPEPVIPGRYLATGDGFGE